MKYRDGFVSNSSSSSFVIIGVELKKNKLVEFLKKYYPDHSDNIDKICEDYTYDLVHEVGLSCYSDEYDDNIIVGNQIAYIDYGYQQFDIEKFNNALKNITELFEEHSVKPYICHTPN